MVIWASAAFAGYESIRKLLAHGPTTHSGAGIAGAVIGIVGNLIVARYKLVVGRWTLACLLETPTRSAGGSPTPSPSNYPK